MTDLNARTFFDQRESVDVCTSRECRSRHCRKLERERFGQQKREHILIRLLKSGARFDN